MIDNWFAKNGIRCWQMCDLDCRWIGGAAGWGVWFDFDSGFDVDYLS